jgi:hypothetical protein
LLPLLPRLLSLLLLPLLQLQLLLLKLLLLMFLFLCPQTLPLPSQLLPP